jgi:hypothetical protein
MLRKGDGAMTFTFPWLIFAFIAGAFFAVAAIVVLSALWVSREDAQIGVMAPCDDDEPISNEAVLAILAEDDYARDELLVGGTRQ